MLFIAALSLMPSAAAVVAEGQEEGGLDLSFGRSGKVVTDIPVNVRGVGVGDMAVQADGRTVVVGAVGHGRYPRPDVNIMRFNEDGTLDETFGLGGKVATSFFVYGESATAVVIQEDGKILVGGHVELTGQQNKFAFLLMRCNPDGSPDYAFGDEGLVTTIVEGSSSIYDLFVQPDGKIVAGGISQPEEFELRHFGFARFNSDGSLDTSFGNGGKTYVDLPGQYDYLRTLVPYPGGKILAAGEVEGVAAFVRLMPDGTPDADFGSNGQLKLTGAHAVNSLVVLPDGKILSSDVYEVWSDGYYFAVRRQLPNGEVDTSFSGDGVAGVKVGTLYANVSDLLVDANQRIVLAGSQRTGKALDTAVGRLNADGTVDSTFGNGGVATESFEQYDDGAYVAAFGPGGKIVLAGYPVLSRFTAEGDLDLSFGSGGKVETEGILKSSNTIHTMALQPDGKILAFGPVDKGECDECQVHDWGLARFHPDGSLDRTFGNYGILRIDLIEDSWDYDGAMLLQPDGKILLGGTAASFSGAYSNRFVLMRLLPSGAVDPSFGTQGKVITSFSEGSANLSSLALLPDGKVLAGGTLAKLSTGVPVEKPYRPDGSVDIDFVVMRYNPDGGVDTGFGTLGKTLVDFAVGSDHLASIAVAPGGQIIAAGETLTYTRGTPNTGVNIALARLLPNGQLDSAFGTGGKVISDYQRNEDYVSAMALDTQGRILVAGKTGVYSPALYQVVTDFALSRFDAGGELDGTFGQGGILVTDFGAEYEGATNLIVSGDGKITSVGYTSVFTTAPVYNGTAGGYATDIALTRHLDDGSIDTSFGTGGKLEMDLEAGETIYDAFLDANGKLVLGGGFTSPLFSEDDFLLVRFGNDGTTPGACAISFSDVPEDSAFYQYIHCLACRGAMGGYADGTFRPGNNVTRAQLAKIVGNASGITEAGGPQRFQDVPNSGGTSSFYDQINGLVAAGVMSGYACGGPGEPCIAPGNLPYFRPGSNATRGQIAKIVANAAMLQGQVSGQTFTDVAPGSPFYPYIQRLTAINVMSGYPCGGANPVTGEPETCDEQHRPYFRPGNNATRGQVSKIVANTFYPDCQTPARR